MLRVLTTHTFSAELLRAQAQALERHMACDYVLTVVNDAKEDEHFSNHWRRDTAESLEATAKAVGARHIRFPQVLHDERWRIFPDHFAPDEVQNANTRCADAVQYGVNLLLSESDEPLLIIDADMVPYDTIEAELMLAENSVWGVPQFRGGIIYLWNGLILMDPEGANRTDLFDLNCAHINGTPCDVGGMLYRFVQANRNFIGFRITSAAAHIRSTDGWLPEPLREFFIWDCDTQHDHYRISETYGDLFAHLGGGGNWEVRDQEEADERMRRFVEAVS